MSETSQKSWIRRNWVNVLLVIALGVFAYVRFYGNPKSVDWEDLSLENLDGTPVQMAQFEGKPLVVHFWATWCGPCRSEMPGLLKAQQAFGEKISFVLVSDEKIKTLQRFQQSLPTPAPIYHKSSSIKLAGIFSIPQTYVYDRKGNKVAAFDGAVDWQSAEAQALLKGL